jgi:3-oxoacyl-[acyl-carrier-protein] synthase-3
VRKFERTTGIKQRRYANLETTASDLGFEAAKKIFEDKKCESEITALIFISQTADYKIPFTSNILQDRLGLSENILCLDINAGCAGFIQGLSTAYALASTTSGKVLLIVAETLSKILSREDRSTSMLFGDGAAALIISRDKTLNSKSYFNFFSDGSNADAIIVPDGGCRNPFSKNSLDWIEDEKGNKNRRTHLAMDGPRVFDFTLREIPSSVDKLISEFNLNKDEIDLFLFHQSNKFIINQIASRLGLPKEKVLINIDRFGNTSGVTIPLLIVSDFDKENMPKKILISGYGSGLNWGCGCIAMHPEMTVYNLLEY